MLDETVNTENNRYRVAVIGAGPAGISAAIAAAAMGVEVDWYDKENRPGGKMTDYHQLFPDRELASQILEGFAGDAERVEIGKRFGIRISRIEQSGSGFSLYTDSQIIGRANSVIIANGFDYFDARLKEEFGYGVYSRVITSPDLERILKSGPDALHTDGADPATIAFVHCVGSRDQQAGISYCSRLCCVTGIKQAIEMKELFPGCRVINFYIDIRAFGNGYEELFREAQEKWRVQFIRGRVSEASETAGHRIVLKAEDTLMARPLKVTVDWLVLLVGMVPSCSPVNVGQVDLTDPSTGFSRPASKFRGSGVSGLPGVFLAGACTGPMSIPEAAASGRAAAVEALHFLKNR